MMTLSDIARVLGVRSSKIPQGWIRHKRLEPSGYRMYGTLCVYQVSDDNLRAFLYNGGALSNTLNPIGVWRAVVQDAQADLLSRYVSSAELSDALGVCMWTIGHYQRTLDFPLPARLLHTRRGYYERAAVRAWLAAHPERRTKAVERLLGER